MPHRLFTPYVGKEYHNGIGSKGLKVLVLGASYYCTMKSCRYYDKCTSPVNGKWHSEDYVKHCIDKNGEPFDFSNTLDADYNYEGARSFLRFAQLMNHYLEGTWVIDEDKFYELREQIAFTEYVQHIKSDYKTTQQDVYNDDNNFQAFEEVLDELEPDVVIVWGCVTNQPLLQAEYTCKKRDDNYLWEWDFKGRSITFFNIYHPSSPQFYTEEEWETMLETMNEIFGD